MIKLRRDPSSDTKVVDKYLTFLSMEWKLEPDDDVVEVDGDDDEDDDDDVNDDVDGDDDG